MISVLRRSVASLLLFSLLFLFVYATVLAHGSGVSYEETKDGYLIDIGFTVAEPAAFEAVRFDLNLYPENNEPAEEDLYTDVWVRIAQDRDLFFSGGINKPVFGATGFTYQFPKAGTYEILIRFQKEGETVVETSFPMTVSGGGAGSSINPLVAGGVGALLGVAGMFFLRRKS